MRITQRIDYIISTLNSQLSFACLRFRQHVIQNSGGFSHQPQAGAAGVKFRRPFFLDAAGSDRHIFQQLPADDGFILFPEAPGVFLNQGVMGFFLRRVLGIVVPPQDA